MSEIIAALATDARPRQVFYDDSAPELLRQFFGRHLSAVEVANLVGASDGSVLIVAGRGDLVFVQSKHPKLKAHDTFIGRNSKGQIFIRLDEIELQPSYQGQREGLKLLSRQICQAKNLNVAYLEAEADGNPKTFQHRNGFYVWARYGFSAVMTPAKQALLPNNLKFIKEFGRWREAETWNDLMLNDGQSWWRENGEECLTFFDLRDNSSSLRVLEKYVLELRQEGKL